MLHQAREWINQHRAVVGIFGGVLVIGLLWMMLAPSQEKLSLEGKLWFYDTVSKEIFTDSNQLIPPISSPQGNEAVLARFYTCGDCTEQHRFIAYYEKYSAEGRELLEAYRKAANHSLPKPTTGKLLSATAEDDAWVAAATPEAAALLLEMQKKCRPPRLRACQP